MRTLRVVLGVVIVSACAFILSGCFGEMEAIIQQIVRQNALDAINTGKYDEAIKDLKSCVEYEGKTGTNASWCSCMLGEAYLKKGQYPEAITYLKRGIDVYKNGMFPGPPNSASNYWSAIYNLLGIAYYLNAQYQQSVNAFNKSIELKPTDIVFYTNLADAYRKLRKYDDAIAAVKRSIEIRPNDYAYGMLASIYEAKKQYAEAVAARKKAIELNPESADLYFRLAETHKAEENFTEAVNRYREGLSINPDDISGLLPLANVYMAMGQFQEAINILNQSISVMTRTAEGIRISIEEGYPVVTSVMVSAPAYGVDVQVGDKIIRIDGKSAENLSPDEVLEKIRGTAGTSVVLTISRKGSNKPLEKTITRKKFSEQGTAVALALRSFAERALGKSAAFQEDAEKAYSIDREDPRGMVQSAMSVAYMDKGRYVEALSILSEIKDNPFARMLEATAYAKLGAMKKAIEIYTSIPEDYLVSKSVFRQSYKKALLESLKPYHNTRKESAESYEAKGQYKNALMEYAEILKISDENDAKDVMQRAALIIKANPRVAELPEEARRHVMRAEVLTKEGKFEDAVKEYKEATKIAPFFPALYKAIALNYAELKLYQQAINNLKTYLALSPDAPDARTAMDEIYKWEFLMEKGGK